MQNSFENKPTAKEDDADLPKIVNTKVLSRTTIANLGKTRTNTSVKIDHSKDKELINNGLQRLVSNFKSHNRISHTPSKMYANKTKLSTPSLQINSMTDRQPNSHIVLTKQMSVDKYTMTDFKQIERKVEQESTILNEEPYNYKARDLQWTDPRLLKKYSLVKQPCQKALTVPFVNKSDYGAETEDEDEKEDGQEVICPEDQQFIFKLIYYVCTMSVSVIGFTCGISLISLILWKVLDENIVMFYLQVPTQDLFFKRNIKYLARVVVDVLNNAFGKITRLLTISVSEVFANYKEEPVYFPWFYYRNYNN